MDCPLLLRSICQRKRKSRTLLLYPCYSREPIGGRIIVREGCPGDARFDAGALDARFAVTGTGTPGVPRFIVALTLHPIRWFARLPMDG